MLDHRDAFIKQGIEIVEQDTQIYLVLTKADRIPEKLLLPELDLNKAAEGFRHFVYWIDWWKLDKLSGSSQKVQSMELLGILPIKNFMKLFMLIFLKK